MAYAVYNCWHGNRHFYFYCWFLLIFLKYIVGLFTLSSFLSRALGFSLPCHVLHVSKRAADIEADAISLFYIKIARKYLPHKNTSSEFDKTIDLCFVYGNPLNLSYIISGYILFLRSGTEERTGYSSLTQLASGSDLFKPLKHHFRKHLREWELLCFVLRVVVAVKKIDNGGAFEYYAASVWRIHRERASTSRRHG